jgi:hypothetical protein
MIPSRGASGNGLLYAFPQSSPMAVSKTTSPPLLTYTPYHLRDWLLCENAMPQHEIEQLFTYNAEHSASVEICAMLRNTLLSRFRATTRIFVRKSLLRSGYRLVWS